MTDIFKKRMQELAKRWRVITEEKVAIEVHKENIIVDENNENIVKYMQQLRDEVYDKWKGKNILLMWNPWIWKTYLAEQIFYKHWFVNEHKLKLINSKDLFSPWNVQINFEAYPMEKLMRRQFMIYDDLWASKWNDDMIARLVLFLDERIRTGKHTIFTTNLSSKDLQELDWRIYSRIKENCVPIIIEWPDRRWNPTGKGVKLLTNKTIVEYLK